jgi:2-dehydro-3-deoxyphosphogluconate aldolase/(4S)-4-hydroxy-2-oxoglutarate aldolase
MRTFAARKRTEPPATLLQSPLIAVLRTSHAKDYAPVVETLAGAGVSSIELTLSTPGTLDHLQKLQANLPDGIKIGIGTVTDIVQAIAAIEAGASFLVTPVTDTAIVESAAASGVPVYPGGFTPTELCAGWTAGATAVKIFPASVVGPEYISHLRGPFPDIQIVPSGGLGLDDIPRWMGAGALAVSLGGPLIGDAFQGGSLVALRDRAERALELAREGKVGR